jgi:hypothetical protein
VDNRVGFPPLVQVETAAASDKVVLDHQAARLINAWHPPPVPTDNRDTPARCLRQGAKGGGLLWTPALTGSKGRYAAVSHRSIDGPEQGERLRSRRTAIAPMLALGAQAGGATAPHKQFPMQRLANVRTCLTLAPLTRQVAKIATSFWDLPLRNLATIVSAFT